MAQWLGQFSGHTHATKVKDAEDTLRHAVASFRSAGTSGGRGKKEKAVGRLADRLLIARLKFVKASIAEKTIPSEVMLEKYATEIAALERKEAALREGGVAAILREFGADDVPFD